MADGFRGTALALALIQHSTLVLMLGSSYASLHHSPPYVQSRQLLILVLHYSKFEVSCKGALLVGPSCAISGLCSNFSRYTRDSTSRFRSSSQEAVRSAPTGLMAEPGFYASAYLSFGATQEIAFVQGEARIKRPL
jgi:hypothetical protein